MAFISPEEVATKAKNAYSRFLTKWIRGEDGDFFPLRIPANLKPDRKNPKATIAANQRLLESSKVQRGWGYTVHRQQIRSRDLGNNSFPQKITIDTREDLLRLADTVSDFAATQVVVEKVRASLPELAPWLSRTVKSLAKSVNDIDDLILVAQFFQTNPWPDCYARQIPVPVDTKFIQRHQSLLATWLDLLLPASAIDVNEKTFARRFGLRDGDSHRAIRLLDPALLSESQMPFAEFSLPLRRIAGMNIQNVTVFVVENDLNLLTLPKMKRAIAIRGVGNAVNRLERVGWLQANRVIYWGDIDVEGIVILARLRNLFPHVESFLMDLPTLDAHREFVTRGSGATLATPTNLTGNELDAFEHCQKTNQRLEQEKIPQPFVDQAIRCVTQR